MPKRARTPACIASEDDGTRCQALGTIPDPQRGGLVCARHDPERWRRFVWDEEDAEGLTWTLPDGTRLDPEEDA
jgi:hypothetical protein